MLTKEQVDAARHQIEHEYDGYAGPHDEALWNAHEALSAYERVVGLLERHEVEQRQCPDDAPPAEAWLDWTAELRRALEG
jgi:hypothetical protein